MFKFAKALMAFGAFLGVVGSSLSDGNVTPDEAGAIGAAALGVYAVFKIKNAV